MKKVFLGDDINLSHLISHPTFLYNPSFSSPMKKLFFAPENKKHGDFYLIDIDGTIHNIFIENEKTDAAVQAGLSHGNSYGRATSTDGLTWEYHGKVKEPGRAGEWNDKSLWACQVIANPIQRTKPGKYLMVYTAISTNDPLGIHSPTQQAGMATSDDLKSWKDFEENPIIRNSFTGKHYYPKTMHRFCWRDANIHTTEEKDSEGKTSQVFYAIMAGSDITVPHELSGCSALFRSKDLLHWETLPPIFSPAKYREVETPHISRLDDQDGKERFVLIFGENAVSMSMRYAVADSLLGPYAEPELNVFTPAHCYAGVIFNFKGTDYFYHWIMDRNKGKNERYLTPPKPIELKDDVLLLKKHPQLDGNFTEVNHDCLLPEIKGLPEHRGKFTKQIPGGDTVIRIRSKDPKYSKNVFFTSTPAGLSIRDYNTDDRFNESRTIPIHKKELDIEVFIEDKFMEIYINGYFVYATVLSFNFDDIECVDVHPKNPWES